MTASADNHAQTLPLAEATFRQIRASQLAATPRNYQVCYAYAARHNPSINQIIDDTVRRNGVLSDADLEKICGKFICHTDIPDRVNMVGAQLAGETAQAVAAVDTATETTSACSEQLDSVKETLGTIKSRQPLGAVVAELIQSVATMQAVRKSLQLQLNSSQSKIRQLQNNLKAICEDSQRDPLTGLLNRKSFNFLLSKALDQSAKCAEPLCLILSDIDNFKAFNDRWGHITGDQVLCLIAKSLKNNFRSEDVVARFGGEEFTVVLPKTPLQTACKVADQLRRAVMSKAIVDRKSGLDMGRAMLSMGVACARRNDTAEALIERADACLFAAKRNGRNRVISEADLEGTESK